LGKITTGLALMAGVCLYKRATKIWNLSYTTVKAPFFQGYISNQEIIQLVPNVRAGKGIGKFL